MTAKKLHPSVAQFKEFVKSRPHIIKEVRDGKSTWQDLYEDWYLLGEEDARWGEAAPGAEVKEEEKKSDWMSTVMGTVKKMDPSQVQGYINNLSQALSAVQGVISQFQTGSQTPGPQSPVKAKPPNPFSFRKD
jgi:hypothetical protein